MSLVPPKSVQCCNLGISWPAHHSIMVEAEPTAVAKLTSVNAVLACRDGWQAAALQEVLES